MNGRLADGELALIAGGRLAKPYALRWNIMNARRRAAGLPPVLPNGPMSSYRTFTQQVFLRNQWCGRGACQNAAVPGSSNHGIGRAVDTGNKLGAIQYGGPVGVRDPSDAPWENWHTLVHLDAIPRAVAQRTPVLRRGVVNRKATSRLQILLRTRGFRSVRVNGRFDRATHYAVWRFQKAHKLTADGVVGPSTWRSLERVNH